MTKNNSSRRSALFGLQGLSQQGLPGVPALNGMAVSSERNLKPHPVLRSQSAPASKFFSPNKLPRTPPPNKPLPPVKCPSEMSIHSLKPELSQITQGSNDAEMEMMEQWYSEEPVTPKSLHCDASNSKGPGY